MRVARTTPIQAEPAFRLDPFSLPARLFAEGTDPVAAPLYLDRDIALLQRRIAGLPQIIRVALKSYRGVAIRLGASLHATAGAIVLVHRDPALEVVLSSGGDACDLAADWQAWGNVLGLNLLVEDEDGLLAPARSYLGSLAVAPPRARRHHAQFAERRPRFLTRRKVGRPDISERIAAREIIART